MDGLGRVLFDNGGFGGFDDFRSPFTGTFFLRVSDSESPLLDDTYAVLAAADPDIPFRDPSGPPTAGNDTLVRSDTAADRIDALAGADLVYGRGGDDDLRGGGGSDVLLGREGRDFVYGGRERDRLYGDAGDDRIGGGGGDDQLTGGAGRDVFDMGGLGFDQIADFVRGTDRIDLSAIDANANVAGNQAFTFVGVAAAASVGQLRYEISDSRTMTFVRADTNGDGDADVLVNLAGPTTLAASDFVLY